MIISGKDSGCVECPPALFFLLTTLSLCFASRDQALYQCVAESLKKSGVLLNYVKPKGDDSAGGSQKRIKWHDLSSKEYCDAAAQVHSVVFAQLGTLSHSMLELGCGISRACSFVRRLSIRYQLPLSLRITLIQHLIKSESETKL
jgi:hypothetical protein